MKLCKAWFESYEDGLCELNRVKQDSFSLKSYFGLLKRGK